MSTPEYVPLPDFIVFIDRAGHAIAERVDGDGNTVRGVDFGFSTPQANVINAFVAANQETRDALAPAVNVYLRGLIAEPEPKPKLHHCGHWVHEQSPEGWDDKSMSDYQYFCPRCSVFTNRAS